MGQWSNGTVRSGQSQRALFVCAGIGLILALVPKGAAMQTRRAVTVTGVEAGSGSTAVEAGGLIYVSGLTGVVPRDPVGPAPDIADETRRIFGKMKTVLEATGSSLDDVVTINVFLKRAFDFDPMNAAYRTFVGEKPPTRTTIACDLPGEALVMMSAIAVKSGALRETMLPVGWVKSPRPYSYIVRTQDLVFLSGLVSRRGTDDQVVGGPIQTQMRTVLGNAGTLLKTAGVTFDDVVSARVFLTDDLLFEDMNTEYQKTFRTNPPARATGVVGLMGPDNTVEITLVASRVPKAVIGPLVSPTLPVSTAVRAGNRTFLSGVIGNTDTNVNDQPAQMREALTKIGKSLEMAGVSFADVVDSTVYLRDIFTSAPAETIWREFFPTNPPANTTIGAKLVARTGMAEVIVTAVK